MNKYRDYVLDESVFIKPIPKYIMDRIKWYYEEHFLGLADAIREGFRDRATAHRNTVWYKMWYHDDYREICPSIYIPEYLDMEKYPLYSRFEEV